MAPALGAGYREFESLYTDQFDQDYMNTISGQESFKSMRGYQPSLVATVAHVHTGAL
jgi:hypothetical protein